jgi:hypothetical protein
VVGRFRCLATAQSIEGQPPARRGKECAAIPQVCRIQGGVRFVVHVARVVAAARVRLLKSNHLPRDFPAIEQIEVGVHFIERDDRCLSLARALPFLQQTLSPQTNGKAERFIQTVTRE